jgi:MoaA/NifB/PqqE/SkfB family radical SAM enzyme
MEFLYYSRQWPGTFVDRVLRFVFVIFLEFKRIFTGVKYIAEFDLSDECNLRCIHCYHFRSKKVHNYERLPIEVWNQKFQELHRRGVRRLLLIGGEPVLRLDVIQAASQIFPYIDICSNGTIRVPDFYKQKIFVSIDGDQQMHDYIRGEGVFSRILSNYKNDKRVVISMTITNENYTLIEHVVKLAIENRMIGVSCDVYTPAPSNSENDIMFMTPEIRRLMIKELWYLKKKYPRYFLMSKKSIKWYENPDHSKSTCYWRSAVIHFNTQLLEKPACDYYDCGNCGHFAGANLSPLNFLVFNDKGDIK